VECYTSKVKVLGWLAGTGVLVAGGYFCTTKPDLFTQVSGWLSVAFFGLCFVVFSVQLLKWGPAVIINETGIEDRRMRIGIFLWEDITAVSSYSVDGGGMLYITVKNPEKYLARMRWWKPNVAKTFAPIEIKCFAFTPGFDEILRYIQFRMRDHVWIQFEDRQDESNQKGHFSQLDP
jgi:hypothetical protein